DANGNGVVLTVSGNTPLPNLVIDKHHDPPTFVPGGTGTYTLTVTNNGPGPTDGTPVIVTDTVPPVFHVAGVSFAPPWDCHTAGNTVTCSRSDILTPPNSYPPITINVTVAADATTATNVAVVSGGGDPTEARVDDLTPVAPVAGPVDFQIKKTHEGTAFTQGQTGVYFIDVTNVGTTPNTTSITVRDTLPGGLTATAFSGVGWDCSLGASVVCTHDGPLPPPTTSEIRLTVNVNVPAGAPATVTNTATLTNNED